VFSDPDCETEKMVSRQAVTIMSSFFLIMYKERKEFHTDISSLFPEIKNVATLKFNIILKFRKNTTGLHHPRRRITNSNRTKQTSEPLTIIKTNYVQNAQ
jgi:hypothetical protein